MHHVVLLLPLPLGIVDGAVEDKISRLELLKFQVDWQSIILVALIPAIQFEAKVFPQVIHNLTD